MTTARIGQAVLASLVALAGCESWEEPEVVSPTTSYAGTPQVYEQPPPSAPYARAPEPAPPTQGAGRMLVQLEQPIGLGISRPGDRFTAVVADPLVDPNGRVEVPAGARVNGHVADLRPAQWGQPAQIALAFDDVEVRGYRYPIAARVVGADVEARRHGVDWRYVVGGAAGGGVLGAILGRGGGAIAGAALGAGAGTLISLGTQDNRAVLPSGTALAVELEQPLYPQRY